MDEDRAIARAERLWQDGRRADALQSLNGRLRRAPRWMEARRTLAGFYRELGAPDQAGRWGIAVTGWTTPVERDRAARLIASSGAGGRALRKLLALPEGALPPDLVDLMPDVERQRQHLDRRWRIRHGWTEEGVLDGDALDGSVPSEPGPPEVRTGAVVLVWRIALVVFAVDVLAVWAGTLLGASMTGFARWGSAVSLVTMAAGCVVEGRRARSRGHLVWADLSALCALLLAYASASVVALAVVHGGMPLLSWEE